MWHVEHDTWYLTCGMYWGSQTALAVIGNIAFHSARNKGKIISFTFTGDEFTQSPPATSNVKNVFPRQLQTAPIELIFCGVWDIHFEKLDSSLQQCQQLQSVRALFYAEPQLGPVLKLWISSTSQPFQAISSHFKNIGRYLRQFQAFQDNFRLFQYIPPYSSTFLCMSVYLDQFHFSHHMPWLCVSEALCLECCFPLEPKAFCKLRVYIMYHHHGDVINEWAGI